MGDLPAVGGGGDLGELLGLVAALELGRMEQVVDEEQPRADHQRRGGRPAVRARSPPSA